MGTINLKIYFNLHHRPQETPNDFRVESIFKTMKIFVTSLFTAFICLAVGVLCHREQQHQHTTFRGSSSNDVSGSKSAAVVADDNDTSSRVFGALRLNDGTSLTTNNERALEMVEVASAEKQNERKMRKKKKKK